ncbi:hypothetical protein [Paenibacillus brasilensis]|uniref:Uncharacterized protein n=1 Tax=Paenibacillus brasilensis TaxID=128574 RepID=A0ABU0KTP5_9BACL|nr:hypothetical protein [Paenibacillus brasilensis]MDQ0492812.1 hypothetical protein [Paenibacillus brasilensis]
MLKLKKTAIILTGVLALTAVAPLAPLAASAAPTQQSAEQANKEVKQLSVDTETLNAITDIEKFIKLDGDHYVLDPAAKEVVSERVFNNYSKAVESVNDQLKNGILQTKNGELVANPNHEEIGTNMYGSWHWWGYALTLSDYETKTQINAIENTRDTSAFVFSILAAIPGLQGTIVPATILTTGVSVVLDRLKDHDNGRGVTINFHPGYFEVTSN